MAPKSSEKKSRKPLTWNQKLEMIKLHGEGNLNAEIGRRLGLAQWIFKNLYFPPERRLARL